MLLNVGVNIIIGIPAIGIRVAVSCGGWSKKFSKSIVKMYHSPSGLLSKILLLLMCRGVSISMPAVMSLL